MSIRAIKGAFGPGGRSSTTGLTVTVFGGHGFIGRYLLSQLGSSGTRVNLPYRGDEFEVRHVKPAFDLGQLAVVPFHPRDHESIRSVIARSDVVVNCIGKYYETKHLVPTRRSDGKLSRVNYNFTEVHSELPKAIASIAKEMEVPTFIHVSALSANPNSASVWSQSKANGEKAVREVFPDAVFIRPATVFGSEDRFLNWIADTTTKLPFFPLVNSGSNLVQPVYVLDIAKAIFEIVKNPEPFHGKTFEFAGPVEYTHREVAEFVQDVIMRKKICLEIPESAARAFGRVVEELVSPMLTVDMVAQILEDNILSPKDSVLTFNDLGLTPSRMDRHAFDYLHRFRKGGHFTLARGYH